MSFQATTFSGPELGRRVGEARRAADRGPVFITERGRPTHVLISMDLFRRLNGNQPKIADLLALPGDMDAEPDFPISREPARAADFS